LETAHGEPRRGVTRRGKYVPTRAEVRPGWSRRRVKGFFGRSPQSIGPDGGKEKKRLDMCQVLWGERVSRDLSGERKNHYEREDAKARPTA